MSAVCPTFDAFILPVSSKQHSSWDYHAAFVVNPAEAEGNHHRAKTQFSDPEDIHLIIAIAILLWSCRLRATLRWMRQHHSHHVKAPTQLSDEPFAPDSSGDYPGHADSHSHETPVEGDLELNDERQGLLSFPRSEVVKDASIGSEDQRSALNSRANTLPKRRLNVPIQAPGPSDDPSISVSEDASVPPRNDTTPPRGGRKPAVQPTAPPLTIPNEHAFFSAPSMPSPLETSLFVGSSELIERIALSLLVIAYGQRDTEYAIEDPEHDAQYLRELFEKLDGVHFQSLLDSEATLARIDESIKNLWHQAPPNSHLLLLLTGHGNDNAMELHGPGDLIDESYLNKTFKALYQESPKDIPVTIIFDICRENEQKLVEEMDDRVALVWTCSLGQKSFAFKFRSFQMPRSLFLIGLFMASSDIFQELGPFEERLKLRVDQLARFNYHVDHVSAIDGVPKCAECIPGKKLCVEAFAMKEEFAQVIDLSQSRGRMSILPRLIGQQTFIIELSEAISRFLLNNKPFLSSNGLPLPMTSQRGANKPSSQAPAGSTMPTLEAVGGS